MAQSVATRPDASYLGRLAEIWKDFARVGKIWYDMARRAVIYIDIWQDLTKYAAMWISGDISQDPR